MMDTKSKKIIVNGFVIKDEPYKEYDKKLTLLTKEIGKISVYAHGVRRQNSKNINSASLYTYCAYEIIIDDNFYTLSSSKIIKSYIDLTKDYDKIVIASYFLEILYNISYENIESNDKIMLLNYALNALVNLKMDIKLIKSTFDIKLLISEGLLSVTDVNDNDSDLLKYTLNFVLNTPINKVFSFNIEGKEKVDFIKKADNLIKKYLSFDSKVIKKLQ